MTTENFIIEAKDCKIGYQDEPLINNLNLQIKSGEWVVIIGSNGSGKTTFLRSLLGLTALLSGHLLVLGKYPRQGNTKISYLSQLRETNLTLSLRGDELVGAAVNGWRLGLPILSKKNKAKINECLQQVDGVGLATQPFNQLSGGQRQRLRLAQALVDEPCLLLLLDEPLTYLDPEYQKMFIELLASIQQKNNMTIVMVMHDLNYVLPYASQLVYLNNRSATIGKPEMVLTQKTLSELYNVPSAFFTENL